MRAACFAMAMLAAASFSPAYATSPAYMATARVAPRDGQIVVHDMLWRCSSGSCTARRDGKSTDATICSAVARNLGPLTSFAVGDEAFDATTLEKCNRRTR